MTDALLERMADVATHLRAAGIHRPVFVGGAIVGLLLTDPAAPSPRPTLDVDVVVDAAGRVAFERAEERLRAQGHRQVTDGPICRWMFGRVIVDVMPADATIFGFGNRWYRSLIDHAEPIATAHGPLWIASPTHLIATKLDAFSGRGAGDYAASPDIEDILLVVDGRPELEADVHDAPLEVAEYVRASFRTLVRDERFVEAIDMHLMPDEASQARKGLIVDRMTRIASAAKS